MLVSILLMLMLVLVLKLMLVIVLVLMIGMLNHQSVDQVALLRGGWNELMIAGFSHRSTGIPNGEKTINFYKLPVLCSFVAKSEMLWVASVLCKFTKTILPYMY